MVRFCPALLGATLGAMLVVAPAVGHAFYVESRSNGMDGMPAPIRYEPDEGTDVVVEYRVNPSSFPEGVEGINEAIDAAFATWSSAVDCDTISFTRGDDTMSVDQTHWMTDGDEIYVLVFFEADMNEWLSGPSVGRFFWSHDGTGKMTGATVFLNAFHHTWSTDSTAGSLDVQSIVTALVGRSLGITSAMEGNATYPSYQTANTDKRTLGSDDIAAMTYIYPGDGMDCMMPDAPEEICTGSMPDCPPRPMTGTPDSGVPPVDSDGGTTNPGTDSGTPPPVGQDSGSPPPLGMDAGTTPPMMMDPDDDEGCGCRVASQREAPVGLLGLLGLALLWRRRR